LFLPPNVGDGTVEVVAAADTSATALENARRHLGLQEGRCYTDVERAFDESGANACAIVVPPAFHEQMVDLALAHGMHILSEKPIADTMEASLRIARKVRLAGVKMGVTMTHRFCQDKTTLREVVLSGRYGPLDYAVLRLTTDCRQFGSIGRFRHEMQYPLLIEGAVHHLDLLEAMAGAPCETIYAETWNPAWGEFAGGSQAHVLMRFANGSRAMYEAAFSNAVGLSPWCDEYVRAECEAGTLVLDHQRLEVLQYDPPRRGGSAREGQGAVLPLLEQPKWGNVWLIEKFCRWLEGGEAMETNVEDNLRSMALVFAAIESSRGGAAVKVQDCFERARRSVDTQV